MHFSAAKCKHRYVPEYVNNLVVISIKTCMQETTGKGASLKEDVNGKSFFISE